MKNCNNAFEDKLVLLGPFKGLNIPQVKTQGCAAFPRLVGSYDSELHSTLERMIDRPALLVDIGFAEGYYLIGLGKRLPKAQLVGFDISQEAHHLCSELSKSNHLNPSRVDLLEACQVDTLKKYLPAKSIVLCDCEGFEKSLFDEAPRGLSENSDLIVECHDFIEPGAEKKFERHWKRRIRYK